MFTYKIILRLIVVSTIAWFCIASTSLGADNSTVSSDGSSNAKPPSYASTIDDGAGNVIGAEESVQPSTVSDEIIDLTAPEVVVEPEKHIIISLADQLLYVFEYGGIIQRFPVSTGRAGHSTPTGSYSVHSQALRAWSNKYECYMPHWMAITGDGQYGMHALEGTSYLAHLGSVASHGCIRLSPENATWLYGWVEIGTPVEIVDNYDEPPEAKTIEYRLEKRYCM
jgi:lipoprotein-anchoring transpeptidase ErfK/SrfK